MLQGEMSWVELIWLSFTTWVYLIIAPRPTAWPASFSTCSQRTWLRTFEFSVCLAVFLFFAGMILCNSLLVLETARNESHLRRWFCTKMLRKFPVFYGTRRLVDACPSFSPSSDPWWWRQQAPLKVGELVPDYAAQHLWRHSYLP